MAKRKPRRNVNQTRKKQSTHLLFSSKPTFGYYLIMLLIPCILFLIDDWKDLFLDIDFENTQDIWLRLLAVGFFFGLPTLMWLFRVQIRVYGDRLVRRRLSLKRERTYYFKDLTYWMYIKEYVPDSGTQTVIILKFTKKKLRIDRIEMSSFRRFKHFLEKKYPLKRK